MGQPDIDTSPENKRRKTSVSQSPSFSSDSRENPTDQQAMSVGGAKSGDPSAIGRTEQGEVLDETSPAAEEVDTPRNQQESPAERGQDPKMDSLLIKPLSQKERQVLSRKLDAVEMEALVKQFNTDDEIVRLGQRYNKLIQCSVHISTAMSTVMFQVPEYETVKFLKRRLVKYGLGKGVFLSSIDKIYLEVQSDPITGIEKIVLQETDLNMLEVFLYNIGLRAGNHYNIRMAFKSNKADQAAEQNLIEEAKMRDLPNAITNLPLTEDPQIQPYQLILQGTPGDGVEYNVLAPKAQPKASGEKLKPRTGGRRSYGNKWNQERIDALVDFMTKKSDSKSVLEKCGCLLKENSDLFPSSKNPKEGFRPGDIKDKWRNIVGTAKPNSDKTIGFFDWKTAKCDRERLKNTRTLFLEEHQIQMIEEFLKTQKAYKKPSSPDSS